MEGQELNEGLGARAIRDIGSWLITIALVPLSFGIAGDVYVAVWKVIGDVIASAAALFSISTLLVLWYVVPLSLRRRLIQ